MCEPWRVAFVFSLPSFVKNESFVVNNHGPTSDRVAHCVNLQRESCADRWFIENDFYRKFSAGLGVQDCGATMLQ